MKRGVRGLLLVCLCLMQVYCRNSKTEEPVSLTVLLWDEPTTLNPNQDFDSITDSILFNVFEPLVRLDRELHLKPTLAVGWENPSPEIWRFHLRRDVHFHDGSRLNAQIVREALLHVAKAGYETSNILSPVVDVKVVDDYTVDLITKTPSALLSKLPFIHIFKKNPDAFPPFLGTGPYRMIQWDIPAQIHLQAFQGYWGRRPEVTDVRFRPVPDGSQRLKMLMEGQADIIYYLPMEVSHQKIPGISFARHTGLSVYYLGMDLKDEFADLRVRRAISMAVNRTAIINRALRGNGSIPTQPVAPFVFGYDPGLPSPEYNPEKARRLMEEAGVPDGFTVQLDYNQSRQDVAELVRADLHKVGIEVVLNGQNRNAVYELVEQGKSRFFLIGWDCSSGDASEFYEFNLHTAAGTFGQGNYGKYSNPEMDTICEQHYFIMDEIERRKRLQRAGQIAMHDLPVLPLFIEDDLYAMRDPFSFDPRADGQIRIADVTRRK